MFELASKTPDRWAAMVLLAAFTSLRYGEVTVLRRCDLAEDASTVRVTRAFVDVPGQGLLVGPPKSRTVIVPQAVRSSLLKHLALFVEPDDEALLFTGKKGDALRRPNFAQLSRWTEVVAGMGLKGLHFHDLRHADNVWASKAGMSTKDLMAQMGHDGMRAALIHPRATDEAGERIAETLSKLIEARRREKKERGNGAAE
ncbi:tyrosine-type recombinase/integrase [Amycolatopsis sp. NPDC047767]|uniref:tyrosine-type recombinase/integrase n=2 Tax=Amycolatopsis TaxID=1813 RepID=UPI00345353E6